MNTTTFLRYLRLACRMFGYAIGALFTWIVFRLAGADTPQLMDLLAWALLVDTILNMWRLLSSSQPLRGDEIQRYAALLRLKDPWRDVRTQEEVAELGKLGEGAEDRRSGKTVRMLLMALLSIERGRRVVLVGVNLAHARHLARVLDSMMHELSIGKEVKVSICSLPGLHQAIAGRADVDLYIDHAVWENRDSERLTVHLLEDGPVVELMPAGPDHAVDALKYLLDAPGNAPLSTRKLAALQGLRPVARHSKKRELLLEILGWARTNPEHYGVVLVAKPGQEEAFLHDLWEVSREFNLHAEMKTDPWRLFLPTQGSTIEVRNAGPLDGDELPAGINDGQSPWVM